MSLEVAEKGKSLDYVNLMENMSFEDDIAESLGGDSALIAAESDYELSDDDYGMYVRIDTDAAKGVGNRVNQFGWSAFAIGMNAINGIVNGGGGGIPVMGFQSGAYLEEGFDLAIQSSKFLEDFKNEAGVTPELHARVSANVEQYSRRGIEDWSEMFYSTLQTYSRQDNREEIYQALSNFIDSNSNSVSQQNKAFSKAFSNLSMSHRLDETSLPAKTGQSSEALETLAREQPGQFLTLALGVYSQ